MKPPVFRDALGELCGLIETALPTSSPVKRHRDYEIKRRAKRQRVSQERNKPSCKGLNTPVFVQMDEILERTVV